MSEKIPFYFVPPYGAYKGEPDYTPLFDVLSEHYDPHFVGVEWYMGDHQVWLGQIEDALDPVAKSGDPYVVGSHSQSALLVAAWINNIEKANLYSTKGQKPLQPPLGFMAASISPFVGPVRDTFLRHVLVTPDSDYHSFNAKMRTNMQDLSLPPISVPTQLYVGTKEKPYMLLAAGATLTTFRNAECWPAEGARHNILAEPYLDTISQHVGNLATGNLSPIPDVNAYAPKYSETSFPHVFARDPRLWQLLRSISQRWAARNPR